MKSLFRAFLVLILLSSASVALAQSPVVNPTKAAFTASTDHTTAAVTSYTLEVSPQGSATITKSVSLGKPTPDASNRITITTGVYDGLAPNVTYVFNVIVVGPGGSTRSAAPSNPFVFANAPAPATNLTALP